MWLTKPSYVLYFVDFFTTTKPKHTQQVDPVKPADAGIPDRIDFEIGHGDAPVIRAYCEF